MGQEKEQYLKWEVGYHQTEDLSPEKWFPSIIPGAVQLDVMKAENYKQPYWYGNNVQQFDWMEDWYFTYKTTFDKPLLKHGQRVFFHSKGIDYQFKIFLNGNRIYEQEGMFTYVDIDLTSHLKEKNELKVLIMPVPKIKEASEYVPRTETYRQNARESVKPAVSYGWDWHPRLVTRGIWDETYLEIRNESNINNVDFTYRLSDDLKKASIDLFLKGSHLNGKNYKWLLKDKTGSIVIEKEGVLNTKINKISAQLNNPELWWPNGYGDPVLYENEIFLYDEDGAVLDEKKKNIGFRRVRLIMNEGEWERTGDFPKTRNRSPASLEVNGLRIFAKGSNWVHPEIFVGLITPETYEKQIQLAKDANFNLLRVWGGGITNKESFFDYCDKKGIMVWQEFPLACNNYSNESKYLSVLEQEATSIINRVKEHPCLAVWSGGNELFNSWSRMTEQSLSLRLLNSLCYQMTPDIPFIYTSPLYGMGHGGYVFYDESNSKGPEVFQWMAKEDKTAYTEFGISSLSSLETLKKIIPQDELFPPKSGTSWEIHHAFEAWGKDSWLQLPFLEKYFGKIESIEELVYYSQLSQSEGLKFIYEEARRQKPYCSMALNWCFQEPWPTAANNSLINWPNEIKPAYYEVANACRPVLSSLKVSKFLWSEGDEFSGELFILNDTYNSIPAGKLKVTMIYDGGKKISIAEWDYGKCKPFENQRGPIVSVKLPALKKGLFKIEIDVIGNSNLNSTYTFLCQGENVKEIIPEGIN